MTYSEVLPNLHLLHLFCVRLITLIITQQFDSNLQNPELYKANSLLIHQHLLIVPIIAEAKYHDYSVWCLDHEGENEFL